jgi:hypothetical protein
MNYSLTLECDGCVLGAVCRAIDEIRRFARPALMLNHIDFLTPLWIESSEKVTDCNMDWEVRLKILQITLLVQR